MTCLKRGYIPSEMLFFHADVLETIEGADPFHSIATVDDIEFADIVRG